MSTRYYLPSTGAADVDPPYTAGGLGWNKTSEADRLEMVRTKISSAFATKTCSENVADYGYYVLNRQYVSDPIGAHDFTGCTFKMQVRCMEDDAKADFMLVVRGIRIVSGDGQTIRFVLLDHRTGNSSELVIGTLTNGGINEWASGAGSSQNGDRIVVEIGIVAVNTKTTLFTVTMDFGDASGTDLPENETETAQYNPWIEFSHDIPEAAGDEFVYAGDIPVTVLPSTPKGIMSMVYGGDIPLSAMLSYASILDRVYAGAVPLAVLPAAPIAPLEKSYAGAVGFALVPNSTYGLAVEYVYAGDVAVAMLPSYASILDRVYSGDIPMVTLPGYSSILDRIYAGDIAATILPVFPKAVLEKSYAGDLGLMLTPNSIYELISGAGEFVYAGDIPLMALPSYISIVDRVYQGAVVLNILPDFPKALLEKAYGGAISLMLTPESIYSLEQIMEFIYSGNIPLLILSGYSSVMEKTYGGDIGFVLTPSSLYKGMKMATGSQVSREERALLLLAKPGDTTFIGEKRPVLIGKEKPVFISKK